MTGGIVLKTEEQRKEILSVLLEWEEELEAREKALERDQKLIQKELDKVNIKIDLINRINPNILHDEFFSDTHLVPLIEAKNNLKKALEDIPTQEFDTISALLEKISDRKKLYEATK